MEKLRLQVMSDLHCELFDPADQRGQIPPVAAGVDVLVLAGDIDNVNRAHGKAATTGVPTVLIAGNHEWYGREIDVERREREPVRDGDAWLLENAKVEIGGVRFLGCTLWTDYNLFEHSGAAMYHARDGLNDHRRIAVAGSGRRFMPEQARLLHEFSRVWLERELAAPFDGKTVVVTHHLPSLRSVGEHYKKDPLTPAFASDLDALVAQADLWIHGHTHDSCDYKLDKCRVVCNPRGYPRHLGVFENVEFDPAFVVELEVW